jgi:hypothetical protein
MGIFMKNKKLLILMNILSVMFLTSSCDAPRRTRAPTQFMNGEQNNSSFQDPYYNSETRFTGTPPSTETPVNNGFEGCDLSNKFYTTDIGHFGICQSTLNETILKFRSSLTSTTIRTCLIPTYKDSTGASTYIGNPQCTFTNGGQVIEGRLFKDRNGYTNYPINGVIVMKEPLLPEYINCMHAYSNWPGKNCPGGTATSSYCQYWIPRCPMGGKSNPTCDVEARNYMTQVCTNFKSKYTNAYADIRLK